MPVIDKRSVLSGLMVKEAMRRQVIQLPESLSIDKGINYVIKYKINAFLVMDEEKKPCGVVSKTDFMGAYYADFPVETPLKSIMVSPPLFCYPEDSLESALETMRRHGVHRLYVLKPDSERVTGVLAYPDIIGMLYRYCHKCSRSLSKSGKGELDSRPIYRLKVKEVMTPSVRSHGESESLVQVMEGLSEYRLGAVLISDEAGVPVGVLSKTDLIIAYKHGVASDTKAKVIMSSPVRSCDQNELLIMALHHMILFDVHRLFVYEANPGNVVGVFSLSDAARVRSGSCRACIPSRIQVGENG